MVLIFEWNFVLVCAYQDFKINYHIEEIIQTLDRTVIFGELYCCIRYLFSYVYFIATNIIRPRINQEIILCISIHYRYYRQKRSFVNPTYYGPFGATPDIWGRAQCTPSPISYACSICAILMKVSEIKYFDE